MRASSEGVAEGGAVTDGVVGTEIYVVEGEIVAALGTKKERTPEVILEATAADQHEVIGGAKARGAVATGLIEPRVLHADTAQ